MATTTQNKMSKKYYNMVAQQGRHPIPTLAMLRSPLVGKGFLTYRDVGNDCSYNHVAFPPYMEVRSADYAGAIIGRPTWLCNSCLNLRTRTHRKSVCIGAGGKIKARGKK